MFLKIIRKDVLQLLIIYNQKNLFHNQTKHSILKGLKLICELSVFVRVKKYDRTSEHTSGRYK